MTDDIGTITVVGRYASEMFPDGDDDQEPVDPYEDKISSQASPASRSASIHLFPPITATGTAPPLNAEGKPPDDRKIEWVTYRQVKTYSKVVSSTKDPADAYSQFIGVCNSTSSTFLPGIGAWMLIEVSSERISKAQTGNESKWWLTFRYRNAGKGARGNDAVFWLQNASKPPTGKVFQGYDQQPSANIDVS